MAVPTTLYTIIENDQKVEKIFMTVIRAEIILNGRTGAIHTIINFRKTS